MAYLHKTPFYIQWLYPGVTWKKKKGEKLLYLTFDDGPVPEATPEILQILNDKSIKATFFCVGDNVVKHPEIFTSIIRDGHAVGNHTYNHLNGWKTSSDHYLDNVMKCKNVMDRQNVKSGLFRPPYGKIQRRQIASLKKENFNIIMWDVLSGDFDKELDHRDCLKKTIKATTDGSIIIFHDSIKAIEKVRKVLPLYIEYFQNKGYSFASL